MNKKLIAVAVAAAFAAPAAFADAVVYGKMHTSIDMVDAEDRQDNWEMQSRASRLGFKGSEDLGGGLKAIYQFETGISSDGGTGAGGQDLFNAQRNTFIGLAGGFGTFLMGRHDTPAKLAFYASGNERLGDSAIDINGSPFGSVNSPIGVFTERRASSAYAYVTPNFSGFTVAAAAVVGEDNGITVDANDGLADHYSIGLMYKGNGLKAGLGYEKLSEVVAGDDDKMIQAGVSYTMNNLSAGIQYEDREIGDVDYEAWAITGKATFGNNAVSLVYTDAELDNDDARGGWGVGLQHNFSKRTTAYAAYAAGEDGDEFDNDVFSLGMIHSF